MKTHSYDFSAPAHERALALWHIMRRRACEGHLGLAKQSLEMLRLWVFNGLRPPFYLSAGLYRREIDWSRKREFVSSRTYYRLLPRINPPRYHIVTNDKVVTHGLLAAFGIPTPPFYGVLHPVFGMSYDSRPLRCAADLGALLDRLGEGPLVFKPVAGRRGEGFLKAVLSPGAGVVIEPAMRKVPVAMLWDECLERGDGGGYLCEGFIEQHTEAARFHPDSLNTVRAWMWRDDADVWHPYAAVFRMGTGGRRTDNLHAGGLGPRVDLDTGRLHAAIDRRPERPVYETHPTTGVPLEGATVPLWDDVLALCRRTCALFPFLRLIAVDVAIGRDGPLVTEVESTPDEHQVGFDRGHGPLLRALSDARA